MPRSNKVNIVKDSKYVRTTFSLENGSMYVCRIYSRFWGRTVFIDIENAERTKSSSVKVSRSIYESFTADQINMIIVYRAKRLEAQPYDDQPNQIKFIQFLIPLKYREEITGDLSEMIYEMKAKGMKKWAIAVIIYWQLFYICYAALFFKLKEITGNASEGAKEKKEVSK
ncbi:MAG: hypothetical protein AAGG75_08860 [Bacteroidota bacterium]